MKNLFIILVSAAILSSCGDAGNTAGQPKKDPSPSEKLAVLDNIMDTADIKSIRIKTLVNELAKKYGEPADTIAEYTYRAQSVMHDHGIAETNLEVLEHMHTINKLDNTSYSDAVTVYLMLRTGQ